MRAKYKDQRVTAIKDKEQRCKMKNQEQRA
jgi:hypothetical protein